MTTIKEYLVPGLIIIVAALVVAISSIPLQNTEWADSIRTEASETVSGTEDDADPSDIGAAIYFLPLLKVFIFMGIGAFFTWLVMLLIRFGSHHFSGRQRASTG